MTYVLAFATGVLFAIGLAIGGMTQPAKVIGFLDFAGDWDPSLMFVMIGAIAVSMPAWLLARRRGAPVLAPRFELPARRDFDRRLLVGAGIFGVGWGLAGYCPGPGLASIASGTSSALLFVGSMLAGMLLYAAFERRSEGRAIVTGG